MGGSAKHTILPSSHIDIKFTETVSATSWSSLAFVGVTARYTILPGVGFLLSCNVPQLQPPTRGLS